MSIFKESDDTHDSDIDTSAITLDTLVGEDQKYKTADDLAKAYANADAFIAKTKQEMAEKEARLKVLEEMLENKSVEPPKVPDDQKQKDPPAGDPPIREEQKDLSVLVREELEKTTKEKAFADNVNNVSEKLLSVYGNERDARTAVANKAKELNVSVDFLMDVAGKSPNAFYNTIGIDAKSFNTPNSNSDVNTAAFNKDRSRRNFAHYEEVRKTNSKLYYSAPFQREMMKDAREQGDKFFT